MKIILLMAMILCLGGTGEALDKQPVTVDMKLKVDGILVSSPKIKVNSGELATIESETSDGLGYRFEVIPTLQKNKNIDMRIKVAKRYGETLTILSQPRIVSVLGESSTVRRASKTDGDMSLSVTATL